MSKNIPDKSDHSGHRNRMKKKYLDSGIEVFEPHEVLELMLYYAIPMKNTNDIARHLMERFGSLSAILDAPIDVLMDVGLTEHQAMYLKLIPDLTRVYLEDKIDNRDKIMTDEMIAEHLRVKLISRQDEYIVLLLMDSKGRELFCGIISRGGPSASPISTRKIVDLAMRYNASTAVLAHNHPSGVALPSTNDLKATVAVYDALHMVGVYLYDHIIVADDECVSMRKSKMLGPELFHFDPGCDEDADPCGEYNA